MSSEDVKPDIKPEVDGNTITIRVKDQVKLEYAWMFEFHKCVMVFDVFTSFFFFFEYSLSIA
jgi:hypothetical protein